jgi:hypothetical protein
VTGDWRIASGGRMVYMNAIVDLANFLHHIESDFTNQLVDTEGRTLQWCPLCLLT